MHFMVAALLVIAVGTIAGILPLLLVRSRVPAETLERFNGVGGIQFGVVGTLYAVILAFVVLSVHDQFQDARAVVQSEASSLRVAYRVASVWHGPGAARLRQDLVAYTRCVAGEEWQSMRQGRESQTAVRLLDSLWTGAAELTSTAPQDQTIYGVLLSSLGDIARYRNQRLGSLNAGVHPTLWVVLIAGAVIVTAYTCFFGLKNLRVQAAMTGLLMALICLSLWLIAVMDHPFRSEMPVQPKGFTEALAAMTEYERRHFSETEAVERTTTPARP